MSQRLVFFGAALAAAAAALYGLAMFAADGLQAESALLLLAAAALGLALGGWRQCAQRLKEEAAAAEAARARLAKVEEDRARLEQRRQALQQEIARLAVRRELSSAVAIHAAFEDFLEEAVRLAHDLAAAQDLTVFLTSAAGLLPRAHCRLGQGVELCLSFNDPGSRRLGNAMAEGDFFACEALTPRRLTASQRGQQLTLSADLVWRGAVVGVGRLTLCRREDETSSTPWEEALFTAEIAKVRLDRRRLATALANAVSCFDARARLLELACPLISGGTTLGVVQARFVCRAESETSALWEERLRFLRDSALHVAQALLQERRYLEATQDELTGLCNRRHLLAQLEGYFRLACRRGTPLALLMLDIDHFKSLNDRYGHLCGDRALRQVGEILRANIRTCDIAGRYGGEEMAVVVPDSGLTGAIGLAERLRRRIAEQPVLSDKGESVAFTASFGVAE
ncbi:MAG: GGDEF domain-containing protein, partial [Planctomycetota bacterium]|nr:GGDEF domain-containing protein [Planctomycetota bacterium]